MSSPAIPAAPPAPATPPAAAADEVDESAPFPLYTLITTPSSRIPGGQDGAPSIDVIRSILGAWIPPGETVESELRNLSASARAVVAAGGSVEAVALSLSLHRPLAADHLIITSQTVRVVEDEIRSILKARPLTSLVYKSITSKR